MKKLFRHYFRKTNYLVVFTAFLGFCSIGYAAPDDDFARAIKQDDGDRVKALIAQGFDANAANARGDRGLSLSIREGSLKVVAVLLKWDKIQVEVRNAADESPLMLAALDGQTEIARQLMSKGADINKSGWSALHYAATNGHLPIMQMLLDAKAVVDARAPNGNTPLMMAARYGTIEAVRFLIAAGAEPALVNLSNQTALDFAVGASRPDAIALLRTLQSFKIPARSASS